jgi:hypothetical protein
VEVDMTIASPIKRRAHRSGAPALGPQVTFAATLVAGLAAMAVSAATLPNDLVLPVVSTFCFVLAGLVAFGAAIRGRMPDRDPLTYWDVAGILTFIGICIAALIDPEQMVRLAQGAHRDN